MMPFARRPDLVPDLVPKYMVTIGTLWDLLGLAAAPLYYRVPIVTHGHQHNQDSKSLGGTIYPQVTGLSGPISSVRSDHKCLWAGSGRGLYTQLRGRADAVTWPKSIPFCPEPAFG